VTPQYHPGGGWLMDYARGNLSPAFERLIGGHLLACVQCRDDLRLAENIGADFMLGNEPAVTRLTADDIFNSTQATPTLDFLSTSTIPADLDFATLVSSYLRVNLASLPWRGIGDTIAVAKLRDDAGDRLWLLRARPGAVLPRHTHHGNELTLVLQGAYVVGDRVFSAGALEDADEETVHQPIVTTVGECLCLAAATGPLKFEGWIARLAQRYLGI
jgi:putative transcriptional regulator